MQDQVWQLEWSDKLSVGIDDIDAQHRHFIELINGLNRAILDRMDITEIRRRMQLILDDAAQHFAHEEALFAAWHYPDADEHAKYHRQATTAFMRIMTRLSDNHTESEWIEAGLKVKQLLVAHLVTEDMKYRDYFKAHKQAAAS
ncbi:bacteriohemerythrin [Mariprofundus ferrooxydans]|uniref:bacteriohemerythrin n=1 Tax=Mariprofundus ferrooxydans TaxID=314344 RepID=UPI00037EE194|nr:hemerythrin domain-containing protein [Mariprofundus ferrooxydans]